MTATLIILALSLLFSSTRLGAESFRTVVEDSVVVNTEGPSADAVSIGINSSLLINIGAETRFIRGIEIEITAPQAWLAHQGSLVMAIYNNINPRTPDGIADIEGSQAAFEPLPGRLQIIYQIPVRQSHGLRTTTSVTVPASVILPSTFPILFRLIPVIKGLDEELENITFNLAVRPIFSDEGAVRLITRYPPQLRNRPFTVLIDDNLIGNISEQIVLREGEHHLVILSDDYRNESRRFVVERTRVTDLTIDLQDPTPIIIFEGPQNAQIYLDNVRVAGNREPISVEPGAREIRFQIGDYIVSRTLNVQRGKTYRVALNVDLTFQEED